MLKKVALGAAIAVVLVALLAVALALFVDVNRFKPQIEAYVQTNFQRTLTIDGDLRLSVFPRLAVSLPKTRLSVRGGGEVAASVDSAQVSVALLPLLRGELRAGRVRVEALSATVERRRDGSTNFDDLLRGEPAAPGRPASGPPRFEIGGVELVNADLAFRDLAAGTTYRASALNLTTGRLAPVSRFPVEVSARLSASRPAFSGDLKASGGVDLDLVRGLVGLQDLGARLAGDVEGRVFELDAGAAEIRFGDGLHGRRATASARLRGALRGEAKVEIDAMAGTAESIAADALRFTAELAAEGRRIAADLATPAQIRIGAPAIALTDLKGHVTLDDPALPARTLKVALGGTAEADAGRSSAVANLQAAFDDTRLALRVNVPSFAPLRTIFTAEADRLDVDRYRPQARTPAASPAGAKGAPATETPLDFGFLRGLDASGDVRVGEFKAFGIRANGVRVAARAAQGRLDVAPLSAQLYGGNVKANATAQADGNRLGLNAELAGVAVGPLLKDAAALDLLEGRGEVRLALATAGPSVEAMRRALAGTASIRLTDGAVRGIDLAGRLRDARALLRAGGSQTHASQGTQKTDFSEISASFRIRDGVARNDDLDGKSPLLRLAGAGIADIGAGRLDYTLRVSVVATATGQGGRDLADLRGVTVPVRLTGPFEQPEWTIDWSEAARQALLSGPGRQLLQQVAPELPVAGEPRDKLRDQLKDVLKGLRNR